MQRMVVNGPLRNVVFTGFAILAIACGDDESGGDRSVEIPGGGDDESEASSPSPGNGGSGGAPAEPEPEVGDEDQGWQLSDSGTNVTLRAVWGASESDVFAVGTEGTILHFDGNAWSAMDSGTSALLAGIWGFAGDDVFVVGEELTILHYNGRQWSPMRANVPGVWVPDLWSVWGIAPDDLWAVGTGQAVVHYDGSTWSGETALSGSLRAVWGRRADDVIAVGDFGSFWRYDGNRWNDGEVDSVSGATDDERVVALYSDLRGIWGPAGGAALIVGDHDQNGDGDGDDSGAVLRYELSTSYCHDCSYISQECSFVWSDAAPELRAITGTSGQDVLAVGLRGAVAHYDGTEFTLMESPTTEDLFGVWAHDSDAFAVGDSGTIIHWTR